MIRVISAIRGLSLGFENLIGCLKNDLNFMVISVVKRTGYSSINLVHKRRCEIQSTSVRVSFVWPRGIAIWEMILLPLKLE